ncbi:tryptase-2-like isoform X2 [Xiphias gladius]|uniref:tryptase-2-like isoform X2 n=1 Tax=Xiphias gladius TaxID=8245 RepID=UPI001A9A106B|nr:tryptase-2-like isoform X2 [Xiphias gladius]
MAFCKLLTVLVLIHNTGGEKGLHGAEMRSSIVGGNNAAKGRWPWMVHLNITSDSKIKWRCGGTILNEYWVLTAARCWDSRRNPDYRRSMVWVGAYQLRKGAVRYMGIKNVITHSRFQAVSSGFINDIALIHLKKKLIFSDEVQPVSLPSVNNNFGPSSECWITGWGNLGKVPLQDPETLQELKIPILSEKDCKRWYSEITPDMMCAGYINGGKDACDGDYGGPLVCRTAGGFIQAGIMSNGNPDGCGLPGRPGIYTQVSKHLRFINDHIHQREEASAEV